MLLQGMGTLLPWNMFITAHAVSHYYNCSKLVTDIKTSNTENSRDKNKFNVLFKFYKIAIEIDIYFKVF